MYIYSTICNIIITTFNIIIIIAILLPYFYFPSTLSSLSLFPLSYLSLFISHTSRDLIWDIL